MSEEQRPIAVISDLSQVVEQQQLGEATSQVQYVSQGHCLVIGDVDTALEAGRYFPNSHYTIVSVNPDAVRIDKQLTDEGVAVFTVPSLSLSGHLGAWRAQVSVLDGEMFDLAVSVYRESGFFDLVLDLSAEPLMPMRLVPFGYVHLGNPDAASLEDAVAALSELTGEFDKPRYFHYEADICAHSRSELDGCNQCIDVCATDAIRSDGERISVDPFLCQGCGSCATVCPSGAMSYAFPRPVDAVDRTRRSLQNEGASIIVLHTEAEEERIEQMNLPDDVLALLVEEVSAFGPDYWLAMLAGPARHICLVMDVPADDPGRLAIETQLRWVGVLMSDLGVPELPVTLLAPEKLEAWLRRIMAGTDGSTLLGGIDPQWFDTHNDKRQTLRLALDALSEQLLPAEPRTALPKGAPFGQIKVDTDACTLCMACVSTCPARALQDGQDTPALRFVEANCLQCGLCESACPESAITLKARYTWDSVQARRIETLHEEKPFHCARCHTPFTTQSMIDTMTEKLAGHWMFQNEKAVRRLKLCGDCRVRDMFEEDAAGIRTHKDNG
ncbi:4Fe-4S binding protein [Granulosicoccus sp. 3-233]|uniref:4Fe-4S binding protein n=1 Tax=Granulosicoccus sp. 3-233 TaxID=3417969 RepID=UPI003D32B38B